MFVPLNVNLGKVPKLPDGMHVISGGDVRLYIFKGKKHRENGPAEINTRTGYEAWYFNGLRHRENGPAITHPNGTKEFWERGKLLKKLI